MEGRGVQWGLFGLGCHRMMRDAPYHWGGEVDWKMIRGAVKFILVDNGTDLEKIDLHTFSIKLLWLEVILYGY